ncbi:helix-turn-helix domain-containing protein [Corynebacterium amycolatum]|uniref:helix-turn-helix domain-containing protein n=1 Tax=Corynebacterium amycolatum TaxID=43765 RepID=UPI0038D14915
MTDLLTEKELAQELRRSRRTVQRWRLEGKELPCHMRVGNGIFYRRDDVDRWFDDQVKKFREIQYAD